MTWIILIKLIIEIISKLPLDAKEEDVDALVLEVQSQVVAQGIGDLPWEQLLPLIVEIIKLLLRSRDPEAGV
jgi:hypothetical protein